MEQFFQSKPTMGRQTEAKPSQATEALNKRDIACLLASFSLLSRQTTSQLGGNQWARQVGWR